MQLWYKNVPRAGSPGYLKGPRAGSPWHIFVTRAASPRYIGLADYRLDKVDVICILTSTRLYIPGGCNLCIKKLSVKN